MLSPRHARRASSLAIAMAATALLLSGCSQEKTEAPAIIRPVKVVEVKSSDDTRLLQYSGSVRARTEMKLGFRISGKIIERTVEVGQRVKSGDVLARIDATDYALSVKSSAANLVSAERQVDTARLARIRAEQLFAKSVSSKSSLEESTLAYDQAVATRDAAISALDQARNQVRYTDLTADRAGIVTMVNADVGTVVEIGTAVLTVAVDGEKEVQIAVPETDITQFSPGKAVKTTFWSNDALTLEGRVREIAGSADPQSRTFSVRISLPGDANVLLGMTATIEAAATSEPHVITVPLSALAKKDGRTVVWTVERPAGTVHSRPVTLADFTGDGVRVTDGLRPGDVVVAAGTQFMTEGLPVKTDADTSQVQALANDTGGDTRRLR